jgi:hypothetical protein
MKSVKVIVAALSLCVATPAVAQVPTTTDDKAVDTLGKMHATLVQMSVTEIEILKVLQQPTMPPDDIASIAGIASIARAIGDLNFRVKDLESRVNQNGNFAP